MTGKPQKSHSIHTQMKVEPMKPMLARHKVRVLRDAGHTQKQVARSSEMGLKTARRICLILDGLVILFT